MGLLHRAVHVSDSELDKAWIVRRIDRNFDGWEENLKRYGSMHQVERVWYGRVDEAVAIGIDSKLLSGVEIDMYGTRMALLDPNCWPDRDLQRLAESEPDGDASPED